MRIYLAGLAELFANAPAAMISHLIAGLSLALFACLMLLQFNKTAQPARYRRLAVGAGLLLVIQVVQMAFTAFYLKGIALSATSMGLVDQLVIALTLIWVTWLVLGDEHPRKANRTAALLSLVVLFLCTLSILLTLLMPGLQTESGNILNLFWDLGNLLMLAGALVLLTIRRPAYWGIGVLILAAATLGLGLQIIAVGNQLGVMGLIRLTQAISLPWLLVLTGKPDRQPELPEAQLLDLPDESKPVDTKPELIKQLLEINLTASYDEKVKAAIRALSLSVVSDICYLVRLTPDNETIELLAGYDLIREIALPGAVLQPQQLLHIMDAWTDRRTLNLTDTKGDLRDADTLTLLLKYHRIGSLLAFPLHFADQPTLGGLILLSPYTSKRWGQETIQLLEKVRPTLTEVLFGPDPIEELRLENVQQQDLISDLRLTSDRMSLELQEKDQNLAALQSTLQQLKARYQLEKYESVQQMDAMQTELETLKGSPTRQWDGKRQLEQIQSEIRQFSREREELRASLARANARIQHLENQAGQTGPIRLSTDNQIISLDSVAANVRLQTSARLVQAGLTLEISNPDGRQMIKTDSELLGSILKGLVENAIAASPAGATVSLSQSLSLETGMLIAEVTDHGEGLTAEEQSALFNAGQTLIPGIGDLAAIRKAIRAIRILNGKIWLSSKKNDYTTFRIQLPVRIID
jgi:signal transduction histidine kinase